MEIERKFLVLSDTWKQSVAKIERIAQGYLSFESPEVRVRIKESGSKKEALLTVKSSGSLTRQEVETALDVDSAHALLGMCVGEVIKKARHHVPSATSDHVFEVDVYEGKLSGLVTVEVELRHENEQVLLPDWVGQEITYQKEYKNAMLARQDLQNQDLQNKNSPK